MTAHALARKLLAGPDLPVHQSYNYGDYWKTQAAPEITEVTENEVTDCTSIGMPKVVTKKDFERDQEDDTPEEKYNTVIILK